MSVGAISRIESALAEDVDAIAAGSIALIILAGLVAVALSLVASAILQGVVSLEVARGTLGEKLRLGGLWRAARGRIGALIGWTLLLTAALVVAIVIVILIIVGLSVAGGPRAPSSACCSGSRCSTMPGHRCRCSWFSWRIALK